MNDVKAVITVSQAAPTLNDAGGLVQHGIDAKSIHKGKRFDIDIEVWNELKSAIDELKSFRSANTVAYNRHD